MNNMLEYIGVFMNDVVVEIGIKLKHNLDYYENILKNVSAINTYNCETRDLYYTNKLLNGFTENEMKMACVRFRMSRNLDENDSDGNNGWSCVFQNYHVFDFLNEDKFQCDYSSLKNYEQKFKDANWIKVFDTYKTDHQYQIGNMKSRIQLQDIQGIGLILYYDNPDYYSLPQEEQRKNLIDELNSYGFDEFDYNTLGFDKLRTLYYKKNCYSKNQNK